MKLAMPRPLAIPQIISAEGNDHAIGAQRRQQHGHHRQQREIADGALHRPHPLGRQHVQPAERDATGKPAGHAHQPAPVDVVGKRPALRQCDNKWRREADQCDHAHTQKLRSRTAAKASSGNAR